MRANGPWPTADRQFVLPATATLGVRPRKDLGIESLRGIAIVLMVAGHVIGADGSLGLTVPEDSGWRFFYQALEDIRMPLFTVLSGYVYAYRPVRAPGGMGSLVTGKVRRLLVPLVVVGTAFFFVQLVTPGVNSRPVLADLWRIYLFSYQHLWFLQAIFLVFLAVGLLDAWRALGSFRSWALLTAGSGVLWIFVHVPVEGAVFSVDGAIRLLPFFLLGCGAHRFSGELLRAAVLGPAALVFAVAYLLRIWGGAADVVLPALVERTLSLVVAAPAVLLLLAARKHLRSRVLAWLGAFSFGIYLLHVFGTAGARIAASRFGLDEEAALFAVSLVAGVGLPVLFELLLGRFAVVSRCVLGQAPRRSEEHACDEQRLVPAGQPGVGVTAGDVGRPVDDLTEGRVAEGDVGDGTAHGRRGRGH